LTQYTDRDYYAASGKPVHEMELPESYNYIIVGQKKLALPSAVTPLNWSKACQTLLIEELEKTIVE
jgi:hypothetical protein